MPSMDKKGGKGTARMDASKAAQLEETIRTEIRMQHAAIKVAEDAGLIHPRAPTPPRPTQKPSDLIKSSPLEATAAVDPDAAMDLLMSRNLWLSANSGYHVRQAQQRISTMKSDYVWDEEEIAFMKAQGDLDKTFNRRKDEVSNYVEASAQFKHLSKKMAAA